MNIIVTNANGVPVTATAAHEHSAADITSGLLALARGGTGADMSTVAKGGLFAGSGSGVLGLLAAGTDGHILTLDSTQSLGVKWAAAAGGGADLPGCAVYRTSSQTGFTASTYVAVQWDAEVWDPDNMHDNSTNPSRITVPSDGTYLMLASGLMLAAASGTYHLGSYRWHVNGSNVVSAGITAYRDLSDKDYGPTSAVTALLVLAAGDYVELFGYSYNAAGTLIYDATSGYYSKVPVLQCLRVSS